MLVKRADLEERRETEGAFFAYDIGGAVSPAQRHSAVNQPPFKHYKPT